MTEGRARAGRAVVDVVLYTAARLALVAVLTGVIYGVAQLLGVHDFPLMVAMLFALIVALPLGIWIFAPLRRRANASLEEAGEKRRRERDDLKSRLRGE